MRKSHRRWRRMLKAEREKALELIRAGALYRDVAAAIGYTTSAIHALAARNGINRQPKREYQRYTMARIYESGTSAKDMAARLGVAISTVTKVLRQAGVKLRKGGITPKVSSERIAVLRDAHGLGWTAIARRFGLTPPTVQRRYLRWKRKQEA